MKFLTTHQFIQWLEDKKCPICNQKAKWFPRFGGPAYCDDHFPDQKSVEEERNNPK